jgi:imidazolonepropionase-like amidohydrolase
MQLAIRLGVFVAFLCLSITSPAADAPPTDHTVVVRAQLLIDGVSGQARRNQDIIIRGKRITAVGPSGSTQIPQGADVIDLGSATLLPGLIDTHTHIFLQGEVPADGGYDIQLLKYPASFRVARATVAARRALEQGFTTIRDVETEGAGYGDVGIKQAINEGYIPGPRMFVVTRAISSTGGYQLEGYAPEITVPKGAQLIDRRRRQPGLATHPDARGAQSNSRRGAWLAKKR